METGHTIFAILRDSPDPAADDALFGALESADVPTAQAIVETLLVRRTRRGLHGLVAALHLLDDAVCSIVLGEIDRLFGVLREASQSREEQVRLNVLALIHRGRVYRASYLLDNALHDRSVRVREAAGKTLHTLANELLRTSPVSTGPDMLALPDPAEMRAKMMDLESYREDRRQVVSALEAGLATFGVHRQKRLVEAAMWFVDDIGPKFWAMLSGAGGRPGQAALKVFDESQSPRLVPFGMVALRYSQFRPHVAQVLGQCTDPTFLTEWVRQSWRLAQPKAARAMTAIKDLACLDHQAADLLQISSDAHRGVARWMTATGLPSECKIEALAQFQRRGERAGQRAVVWAMTEWPDTRTTTFLRCLVGGGDPEWARIASYELARRRPLEYPLSVLLPADPSGETLRPEETFAASKMTFDLYWAEFDRFTDEEKVQFGQDMLAATATVRGRISRRLTEPDTASRVQALRIITVLNLVESFSDQVYRLGHDADPEVRSTATSALAAIPGATSKRMLHGALYDPDPRVRANAVEAVDNTGDSESAATELLPMLSSQDNRVRANAVKALLKLGVREAAETLLRMLVDEDRAQRVSALWLVDKMGLFTLVARISRMAACDADAQVRGRAQTLVEHLGREGTPPVESAPKKNAGKEKVTAQ